MNTRQKRTRAWLPILFVPMIGFAAPGLGCELLVNVDRSLVDGSPGDVLLPTTLDGYDCPICADVSADADLDGETSLEAGADDSPTDTSRDDTSVESSTKDTDAPEGG
jgi:hypothetical protein